MLFVSIAAENTAGVAVISLVFIVGGYLLLAGLWYLMVYRPSRAERRARDAQSAAGLSSDDLAQVPPGAQPGDRSPDHEET